MWVCFVLFPRCGWCFVASNLVCVDTKPLSNWIRCSFVLDSEFHQYSWLLFLVRLIFFLLSSLPFTVSLLFFLVHSLIYILCPFYIDVFFFLFFLNRLIFLSTCTQIASLYLHSYPYPLSSLSTCFFFFLSLIAELFFSTCAQIASFSLL